ncbi:MAG: hypothetical protein R3Y23_02790, partial [Bacillota bacterium]
QLYCAVSTPHIIIEGDVWLYNDSGEALFMLPNTYYALISNMDESYYYVTFNGISGKVDKNIVSTVGYDATATGTTCTGTIADTYAIFTEIKIKARPDSSATDVITMPTSATYTFIGVYPTGDTNWYYISYNEYCGYIQSELSSLASLEIPDFVPEITETSTEPEEELVATSSLDDSTLRIIIIAGLSVPAIFILYLLFKPTKAKRYYEEDDDD